MKKKILVATMFLLIAVFAFSLTACNKKVSTLEFLQNAYGMIVNGGSFEEGSTLVSNQIDSLTEQATQILSAIADQNYNKDGEVYIFDIYVTKDGKAVQPNGKVTVSIPLPNVNVEEYLVFHVKDDNSVQKIIPTVADGKLTFETSSFSYFIITEAPNTGGEAIHVHNYEWVEGKASTCIEEGIVPHYHCEACGKNFDEKYSEIDSIIIEKGDHDVGLNYAERVEPTFFMEGTVAYYICNDCLQYIGEDGQIIPPTDIFIPPLSLDISVCVNGAPTKLVLQGDFNGDTAEWEAVGLTVKIGDVITVCLTEDPSYKLTFTCDGILNEKGVVTTACAEATVRFYADRSSLHLVMIDPTLCEHNYVWVEGTEPTCQKEGVIEHYHCEACGKNFDFNYGELETITISKSEHEYGSLYWGNFANFFEDGNIEYYQCETCEKYFDNEYNEIETPVIPKYSTNISICVNGAQTALVLVEQYEGHIIWILEELTVKEGDVVTICCTDSPDICHSFSSFGIIDSNGKITMTAVAQVMVEATYNGVMLSINYIYEKTYEHYILTDDKSYDMALDESNPNVVFVEGVTLPAGDKIAPQGKLLVTNQYLSYYFTLAQIDESIAVKNELGYVDIVSGGTFDLYFDFEEKVLTIVEGYDYEHYLQHIGVKSYDMALDESNPSVVFINGVTLPAGSEIKLQAKQLSTNQNMSYIGATLVDTDQSIAVKKDGYFEILGDGTYDFYFDYKKNELTIVEIYQGIVIEINGRQYPMNYVTYPDGEINSYIYGYVSLSKDDTFVIVDNVNEITYGYDQLSADYAWNVWDFHRGDSGEFVVDSSARYGIEFDYDGCKEIFINKVFDPQIGNDFYVKFSDEQYESVPFEQILIDSTEQVYQDILWYIVHPDVQNNEDIIANISEYGLCVYTVTLELKAGMRFTIDNQITSVNSTHLTELYVPSGNIERYGSYVRVKESGYYTITYMPCVNSFAITREADPIYIYFGEGLIALHKDAFGFVYYNNLKVEVADYVAFKEYATTTYLTFTLDSQTDSSIAHVVTDEEMSMLLFDMAGTYNIALNVETGVLSITYLGGGDSGDVTVDYLYYLSVSGGSGDTQTLIMEIDESNPKQVCSKGVVLTENCFIGVIEMASDASSNTTYGTVSSSSSSVAQSYGKVAMIKVAGTYDIYFDCETKTIEIVVAS